ncbi:MAG: Gldg family protein [Candidatus Brocadiia bacterium]
MEKPREKNVNMLLSLLGPLGLFVALAALIMLTLSDEKLMQNISYAMIGVGMIVALMGAGNFIYYFVRQTTGQKLASAVIVMAMVLVVAAILIGANYVVYRRFTSWDLTSTQLYSLTDSTSGLLKAIKEPIRITYIYNEKNEDYSITKRFLEKYAGLAPNIQLRIFNPDRDRDLIRTLEGQYNLEQGDSVIVEVGNKNTAGEMVWEKPQYVKGAELFESGSRGRGRAFVGEQKLTSAILKATSKHKIAIQFSNKNAEPAYDSLDSIGYGRMKAAIEHESKEAYALDLNAPVPSDCTVAVISDPQLPLGVDEFKNLDDYLSNGGKALVMLRAFDTERPTLSQSLEPWLNKMGILLKEGFIRDRNRTNFGFVLSNFGTHPISSEFTRDDFVLTYYCKALENDKEIAAKFQIFDLLMTSSEGALFKSASEQQPAEINSFVVAKAISGKMAGSDKEFRLIVFGDSLLASNAMFDYGVNKNFVMNCINWLAEEEALVRIEPKTPTEVHFTLSDRRLRVYAYFILIGLPLICLYAGVCMWLLRRK